MRKTKSFLAVFTEEFGTGHHTLFVQDGVLFLRILPGDGKTYDYSMDEVDLDKDPIDLAYEIVNLQKERGV